MTKGLLCANCVPMPAVREGGGISMLQWNFDPVRLLWSALKAHSSPSQLASGFAIGVVIGLAPLGKQMRHNTIRRQSHPVSRPITRLT